MSHFAWVENGIVQNVVVADINADLKSITPQASQGEWIQTSYNTRGGVHYLPNSDTQSSDQSKALRKNFAGIGFTYDAEKDAFIPPQDYPSWRLNLETCQWEPPVPRPSDGGAYYWDEEAQAWLGADAISEGGV
jgi:hypothetical protein